MTPDSFAANPRDPRIILTPEGHAGPRYRSPNGRLWRVSRIDGEVAHLWAFDNYGLVMWAQCNPSQLFQVSMECS